MSEALQTLGTIAGAITITLLLCAGLAWVISSAGDFVQQWRWSNAMRSVKCELEQIERWCGHHSPVIGPVCQYLRLNVCSGVMGDTSKLRDQLREMNTEFEISKANEEQMK